MGSVIYKPFRDTMYEVGTDGTVRNAKTLQVLKPSPNTYGYLHLDIKHGDGRWKVCMVHTMVAEVFIGSTKGKTVNHKDFEKRNNALSNLEIITTQENTIHAHRAGRCPSQKVTQETYDNIRRHLALGVLERKELAFFYDLSTATIADIQHGRRKYHAFNQVKATTNAS